MIIITRYWFIQWTGYSTFKNGLANILHVLNSLRDTYKGLFLRRKIMYRGSQNESKIKGATPVAVLSDLSTEEHLAIYYFRCTFETPSVLMDIHREFCSYLGEKVADRTIGALHALITKLQKDGRRKLTRHQLSCNCVGVDENCFAQLVTRASLDDKRDAMLIAVLLSDANVAAELVYVAEDFGKGIRALIDKISSLDNVFFLRPKFNIKGH